MKKEGILLLIFKYYAKKKKQQKLIKVKKIKCVYV